MLLRRVLATLWSMLEPRRRLVFLGLVALMFVSGLLEMTGMLALLAYVRGLSVDPETLQRGGPLAGLLTRFIGPLDQAKYVLSGGALVISVLLVKNVMTTLVQFSLSRFLMKLNERVARRLFEGYLLARYETFTERGVIGPSTRITQSYELFSHTFASTAQVLSDGSILGMVAILLFAIDPVMTASGALVFGGAGALLYRSTERAVVEMGKVEQKAKRRAKEVLNEGFHGVIDGRLNNSQGLFVASYVDALAKTSIVRRRRLTIGRLPQSTNEVLLASSIVGAVSYLTFRGHNLEEALPTLAIFAFAGLKLTSSMSRVSKAFQAIRENYAEFERFRETMQVVAPQVFEATRTEKPRDRYLDDEEPLPPGVDGRLHERLELRDVTFTYPGADSPSIENVNLTIERGSFVAFCGPSGGGKSTIVLALMGLIRPDSGEVLCDGRNVLRQVRAYHSGIGYVGQRMFLANRSVRENVAFGAAGTIDDEAVWQALEAARAADFIRELPEGLDSNLGEAGSRLSGGQRQRIIIARALYKNPEILFFDEATAALDNVTEQEITSAITRLSGQKTIVCVAHRLSTIQSADTIHVVEQGRIVASGSYETLLETSATFRALALT